MANVLFRFNVARIAATTISGEISAALGNIGSPLHNGVWIWALLFGIEDLYYSGFKTGTISALAFTCASVYMILSKYIISKLKYLKRVDLFLKFVARLGINVSAPFICVLYVWAPLQKSKNGLQNVWRGNEDTADIWLLYKTGAAVGLTLVLLVIKKIISSFRKNIPRIMRSLSNLEIPPSYLVEKDIVLQEPCEQDSKETTRSGQCENCVETHCAQNETFVKNRSEAKKAKEKKP